MLVCSCMYVLIQPNSGRHVYSIAEHIIWFPHINVRVVCFRAIFLFLLSPVPPFVEFGQHSPSSKAIDQNN